jgi:RNA polymerase sigma-70 factor (ECF subfamily)
MIREPSAPIPTTKIATAYHIGHLFLGLNIYIYPAHRGRDCLGCYKINTRLLQAATRKAITQPLISMELNDTAIILWLDELNETGFEKIFKAHFKSLHRYAYNIIRDSASAEDIVQNVFYKLWKKMGGLKFSGSITAYLYKSVYHESVNYLKHQKIRRTHQLHISWQMKSQADRDSKKVMRGELEEKLHIALNELPEQCRTIFQLSRFGELRYHDIADRLGISIKTVENQMGKALKLLRAKLVDFLPLILFFLLNILKNKL